MTKKRFFSNWVPLGGMLLAALGLLLVVDGGRAGEKEKGGKGATPTHTATAKTATAKTAADKGAVDKEATKTKEAANNKKGKRPLKTSTVMKVVTKPHCDALKKIFEKGPKTSEDWDALIEHSEVLNEVSYILMEDGRCPDYVWEGAATQTLRNCATAIIAASERRNVVVAQGAFEKLTESCTSCHDAHKEKTSLLELVE